MIEMMGFGGWWTMLFVPLVLALIAYVVYYLVTGPQELGDLHVIEVEEHQKFLRNDTQGAR
jgi:hypothetical protein